MDTVHQLRQELRQEYETTKRFLERFPEHQNEFSPHERSMKLMPLAAHLAEVFGWPAFIIDTEVLNFAEEGNQPTAAETRAQLMQTFHEGFIKSEEKLSTIDETTLENRWKMMMGDQTLSDWSKYEAIRHSINQAIHHRAQLGIYYRLLGIPVPASFGPTADEQGF